MAMIINNKLMQHTHSPFSRCITNQTHKKKTSMIRGIWIESIFDTMIMISKMFTNIKIITINIVFDRLKKIARKLKIPPANKIRVKLQLKKENYILLYLIQWPNVCIHI